MKLPSSMNNKLLLLKIHDRMTEEKPGDLSNAPQLFDYTIVFDHMGLLRLAGQVNGHPRLDDQWITTSPLWQINTRGTYARTHSRWYKLRSSFRSSLEKSRLSPAQKQFLSTEEAIEHLNSLRTVVERRLSEQSH